MLVAIAVVAVLISLLLPSMSLVRESTRRVICASNVHQHGYALAMYQQDYKDYYPPNSHGPTAADPKANAQKTNTVRLASHTGSLDWDGLGLLYDADYLPAPGVFYCPSHWGEHPASRYVPIWSDPSAEIIANYQYRVTTTGNILSRRGMVETAGAVLSDALRSTTDYNHRLGTNVLRMDNAVSWYSDHDRLLVSNLPQVDGQSDAPDRVTDAWERLDFAISGGFIR